MLNMIWPILIVVGANSVYNICAKSTPADTNSFASLSVTYLIAALTSVVMFFVTSEQKNIFTEISKTNWTAWAFGIAIVALEFGYINIYRVGWKVSTGSLVANIMLAVVLVFVGTLLYKESISLRQTAGMAACVIGLILLGK